MPPRPRLTAAERIRPDPGGCDSFHHGIEEFQWQ
jgi:hypothetical protein